MIPLDLREKFLAKMVYGRSDVCWNWPGTLSEKGYGIIQWRRKNFRTHRLSYEVASGPIPEGAVIDHLCRNPSCVNPNHLEAVSVRENTLRGEGITAQNALLASCRKGHPLTPDNLSANAKAKGWRACQTCRNEANRAHRRKVKALALCAAALRAKAQADG